MTLAQTRRLGIEFERRINAMDPGTVIINKLDTDTIYSFLNEYQQKYIKILYSADDQVENNTKALSRTQDAIKTLITQTRLSCKTNTLSVNTVQCELPSDYFGYIRSDSIISTSYKGSHIPDANVPNILCKQTDVQQILDTYYDSKSIMRRPYAFLGSEILDSEKSNSSDPKSYQEYLNIIHDCYTKIQNVNLVYYRYPKYFDISTKTPCELPDECSDDLVTGAVQLYLTYVTSAKQPKQQKNDKES